MFFFVIFSYAAAALAMGVGLPSQQEDDPANRCESFESSVFYYNSSGGSPNLDSLCRTVSIVIEMWCVKGSYCEASRDAGFHQRMQDLLEMIAIYDARISNVAAIVEGTRTNSSADYQFFLNEETNTTVTTSNWKKHLVAAIVGSAQNTRGSSGWHSSSSVGGCQISSAFKNCLAPDKEWSIAASVPFNCSITASASRPKRYDFYVFRLSTNYRTK